jgi:hypothetical protein
VGIDTGLVARDQNLRHLIAFCGPAGLRRLTCCANPITHSLPLWYRKVTLTVCRCSAIGAKRRVAACAQTIFATIRGAHHLIAARRSAACIPRMPSRRGIANDHCSVWLWGTPWSLRIVSAIKSTRDMLHREQAGTKEVLSTDGTCKLCPKG